jgi:hypothetical protein
MPTWAKVLLGIGCGIGLLIIAGIAAGYFFINSHKDEWMAEGKKQQEEGRTYAAGKTANDCVDESLRRLRSGGGIMGEVRVRVFLRGCVDAAAESPQLCESAPPRTEFIRSARWTLDECARRGMPQSQPCSRVMQELQKYCDTKLHR